MDWPSAWSGLTTTRDPGRQGQGRGHLVGRVAEHHDDAVEGRRHGRVDHVLQQRPAVERQQLLGPPHAGAPAGGEDDPADAHRPSMTVSTTVDGVRDDLLLTAGVACALWTAGAALAVHERGRGHRLEDEPPLEPGPLVSVIVPARDEERGIGAAVRSLRALDYGHVEVIVVDDESERRHRRGRRARRPATTRGCG